MNIVDATEKYEQWLCQALAGEVVSADLKKKRKKMRKGTAFQFLRATYWRWADTIAATVGKVADAPDVLAVGDIHLENFGTWRDREGRLVWGVNDYDEAAVMPYTLDLVRLATSALLARGKHGDDDAIAAPILAGYRKGLKNPRPFILDGSHDECAKIHRWLRKKTVVPECERRKFWHDIQSDLNDLAAEPSHIAPRFQRILFAAMPDDAAEPDLWPRSAGLGSLGRPRWAARSAWRGGWVVREAKAIAPSAWGRGQNGQGRPIRCMEIATGRYRSPDPWFRVNNGVSVRRLSPNNRKIEAADPQSSNEDEPLERQTVEADVLLDPRMLAAMGRELAAIHLGTGDVGAAVRDDCATRQAADPDWLRVASVHATDRVTDDWKAYQRSEAR